MRIGILAAVAALTFSAQAQAGQTTTQASPQAREGGRVVFVCDRSDETRRSFEREHGVVPTFVSAEDLAKAQAAKETWSAPRCISANELQRYETAFDQARVMKARGD